MAVKKGTLSIDSENIFPIVFSSGLTITSIFGRIQTEDRSNCQSRREDNEVYR